MAQIRRLALMSLLFLVGLAAACSGGAAPSPEPVGPATWAPTAKPVPTVKALQITPVPTTLSATLPAPKISATAEPTPMPTPVPIEVVAPKPSPKPTVEPTVKPTAEPPPTKPTVAPPTTIPEKTQDETVDTSGSRAAPNIEISVTLDTLEVGETATVAVKVTGDGGLPQYYLNLDSSLLRSRTSETVRNSSFRNPPSWTIEAVSAGDTVLSVSINYETRKCRNGNYYFNFAGVQSDPVEVRIEPGPRNTASKTYTLTVNKEPFYANGGVIVDPLPGPDDEYAAGTRVTLTASPYVRKKCYPTPYWSFSGWYGDVKSAELTIEVTMDSDKRINAGFMEFFPPQC